MDWVDRKPDVPNGGTAASGGCYHMSFRSGSRGSGSCAVAAHDYITRENEYDGPDRDEAVYTESDHMPSWAEDDPREYWDGADLYERENGRLYISADFALPRDLDVDTQIALAQTFAHALTDEKHLPYTLAIHAGRDADGHEHNPHAHLMMSERQNDGIDRSRKAWFSRADTEHPERGGALKSRTFHGREWVEHARERWAALTNATLEKQGRAERVDHRSYERQGLDRDPGQHFGPAAAHMVDRGDDHDRLDHAAFVVDGRDELQAIDRAITQLETTRGVLVHQLEYSEERPDGREGPTNRGGFSRDDGASRGR